MADTRRILTINPGSSSLKAAVYRMGGGEEELELAMEAGGIGVSHASSLVCEGADEDARREVELDDHAAALREVMGELRRRGLDHHIAGIGQRVVHGGSRYAAPTVITPAVLGYLREIIPLDPTHMPQSIAAIEASGERFPGVRQVACFDTAFHSTLPTVARTFPLPREYTERGIRRYGFHGLSYEYVMDALRSIDPAAAMGRVVIAHLGNGASMAAVREGRCIDTTMGLTPAGGLMMGTRTGDLDPGVLLTLLDEGMSVPDLAKLLNEDSGLRGVSGTTNDVQQLLDTAEHDARAAEAIDLFCYSARKFLGAMAAALGGVETLVFTGGIGEHAAPVRASICEGLDFAGLELDSTANEAHARVISSARSTVMVRVIPTNEDLVVARHTLRCLEEKGS